MAASACKSVKVVAVCGSIRKGCYTRLALQTALKGAQSVGSHVSTELLDLRDYNLYLCDGLPKQSIYEGDKSGAEELRAKLREAQAVILGSPEYHGSYSGVLKNALDLCGFDEFSGKLVGLVGVSGGVMGCINGLEQLRTVGRALHAWVVPEQAACPQVWKIFNEDGTFKEGMEGYEKRLMKVGQTVATYSTLHSQDKFQEFMTAMMSGQFNPGGSGKVSVEAGGPATSGSAAAAGSESGASKAP